MAPPSNDFSLYYLFSLGIPILACALLARYVGWWAAGAVWGTGDLIFYAWRRPWRREWSLARNLGILAASAVFGITFVVGSALERVFPRITAL